MKQKLNMNQEKNVNIEKQDWYSLLRNLVIIQN